MANSFLTSGLTVSITDSGSGGLTVVSKLRELIPHANVIYIADSRYAPYGLKTEHWVRGRSVYIADLLCSFAPVVHIIACNTSTAVSLPTIREKHSETFILGTIDSASDMALEQCQSSSIGVISTSLTVASAAYTAAIKSKCSSVSVHELACDSFVELAESGDWHSNESLDHMEKQLRPWLDKHPDIDTLICGCTHFPLLKGLLQKICGDGIRIIDPAEGIIKKVVEYMNSRLNENEVISKMDTFDATINSSDVDNHVALKCVNTTKVTLTGSMVFVASGDVDRLLSHAYSFLDANTDIVSTFSFASVEKNFITQHRKKQLKFHNETVIRA